MATAIDISLMIHPDSTIEPSQSVIDGRSNEMHAAALAVLVASIASKEVLFRKTLECGQATNSSVIFLMNTIWFEIKSEYFNRL